MKVSLDQYCRGEEVHFQNVLEQKTTLDQESLSFQGSTKLGLNPASSCPPLRFVGCYLPQKKLQNSPSSK